jgi:hypothetical protein
MIGETPLRQLDQRVVVDAGDRIVVKVERGWGVRIRPSTVFTAVLMGAVVAVGSWVMLQPYVGALGVVLLGLFVAALPFGGLRQVTLVVSAPDDAVYFEFRNSFTRRKRRKDIAALSSVEGIEVRQHVDAEPEVGGPYFALGLRLTNGRTVPVWYGASREAADRLGSAIMILPRNVGRPN